RPGRPADVRARLAQHPAGREQLLLKAQKQLHALERKNELWQQHLEQVEGLVHLRVRTELPNPLQQAGWSKSRHEAANARWDQVERVHAAPAFENTDGIAGRFSNRPYLRPHERLFQFEVAEVGTALAEGPGEIGPYCRPAGVKVLDEHGDCHCVGLTGTTPRSMLSAISSFTSSTFAGLYAKMAAAASHSFRIEGRNIAAWPRSCTARCSRPPLIPKKPACFRWKRAAWRSFMI